MKSEGMVSSKMMVYLIVLFVVLSTVAIASRFTIQTENGPVVLEGEHSSIMDIIKRFFVSGNNQITGNTIAVATPLDCPQGMLSYWTFDDSANLGNDDFDSNPATLIGPVWSSGKVNGALSFDGNNDYVQLPFDAGVLSDAYTLEAWVYPTKPSAVGLAYNQGIISSDTWNADGIALTVGHGDPNYGVVCTLRTNIQVVDMKNLTTRNSWHHFVCTYDGTRLSLYDNGILMQSQPASGTVRDNDVKFRVGHTLLYGGNYEEYFGGIIDELAVYDRALTTEEIADHYNDGLSNKGYCEASQSSDSDSDGIPDDSDNCPTAYNPDQADSDFGFYSKFGSQGTEDGQFYGGPHSVAADSAGNIYVVDPYAESGGTPDNYIQKFDSNGNFIGLLGSAAQFNFARSVTIDSAGNIYVADQNNDRVLKFGSGGNLIGCIAGGVPGWQDPCNSYGAGSANGQFNKPTDTAVDYSGNIFVSDSQNQRIQKFSGSGNHMLSISNGFAYPDYVAVDSSGNVFIVDTNNNRVQKFSGNGVYITQWGSFGKGNGQFESPSGIILDSLGNAYVADTYYDNTPHRIQKFTNDGTYLATYGGWGSGNGQFDHPADIAFDTQGKLYIADTHNYRVQIFFGDGVGDACENLCGNGILEGVEQCDDGNTDNGDCCSSACAMEDLGATTCGIGVCQRPAQNCLGGQPQSCVPGTPSLEQCNSLDDDCDYLIDEDLGTTTCGTGACQRTAQNCLGGQPQACVPGTPSPEQCDDGIDNDCDSLVDGADSECAADVSIRDIVLQSGLPSTTINPLITKLDTATRAYQRGNTNAGDNALGALINYVKAQSGKSIPASVADQLIAMAKDIIANDGAGI